MTELEMVSDWRSRGYGWQAIGNMTGLSAERAKAKWEIVYEPAVTTDSLILERTALIREIDEYRLSIRDALARVAEIDQMLTEAR